MDLAYPWYRSLDAALSNVAQIESATPSTVKIDRAIWRGTLHFNSIDNICLRHNLVAATKGKAWADVVPVESPTATKESIGNRIAIWDLCRFKYILHTDGVTYSGRLPYSQACESVVLTPPILHHSWTTQHLKPLFSGTLNLDKVRKRTSPLTSKPMIGDSSATSPSWPTNYPPEEANIIFLAPDRSDLEAVV